MSLMSEVIDRAREAGARHTLRQRRLHQAAPPNPPRRRRLRSRVMATPRWRRAIYALDGAELSTGGYNR